jgi:hypothetical protein
LSTEYEKNIFPLNILSFDWSVKTRINLYKIKNFRERSDSHRCVLYAENISVRPLVLLIAVTAPSLEKEWEYVGNADDTYMKTKIITARSAQRYARTAPVKTFLFFTSAVSEELNWAKERRN